MFFSGKEKKTGGSKVLTEAEIKKKLYGDFETVSADVHSASQDVRASGASFEAQAALRRGDLSAGPAPRSSSYGVAPKPEVFVSRPSTVSSVNPFSRKPLPSQRHSGQAAAGSSVASDWNRKVLRWGQSSLGFCAGVLWKLGSYLVRVLDFVLRLLDPRKPQARKLLYSITACVLVAALFFGVFRLNAQRKKAMMGELKPASATVPAAAPTKIVSTSAVSTASLTDVRRQSAPPLASESSEVLSPVTENSESAVSSVTNSAVPVGGKYVIQVATYALVEDAERVIQSMNQAGFTAFFKKQIRNSTGHSFYPVYLGRFETYSGAQQALAKFRKASVARPFQDSFIRTLE